MSIIEMLIRALGGRDMVKIPGKGFSNLSLPEVASMIDNHLSLYHGYPEGIHRDAFDKDALFEFLDYANPNEDLELIRTRLMAIDEKYRTPEEPDGFAFEEAQPELRDLADRLRRGEL